jgi:hypothetical protein
MTTQASCHLHPTLYDMAKFTKNEYIFSKWRIARPLQKKNNGLEHILNANCNNGLP